MRRSIALSLLTLALLGATAGEGRSVRKLDKRQGESALSLVHAGGSVRFYCKPCNEIVYSTLEVESAEVEPLGDGYRLACTHGPVFEAADFRWEEEVEAGKPA